jgi:hypothetical protein
MSSGLALSVALLLAASPTQTPGDDDTAFDAWWHDGQAELSGYRWTVTRYGQPRVGQCVMIFVTEPFSRSQYVKVDDPADDPDDTFDAVKLNLVRDFQTGIYDYNTMTSVFCRSADFDAVKVSFTSGEWCGHVYEELRIGSGRIRGRISSYFQGESGKIVLRREADAIVEDALFVLLRGLRGDYLEPGEVRSLDLLPSAFVRRLQHRPAKWQEAEIERLAASETVEVAAGRFETNVYVVRAGDGRVGRFAIEAAYPHRIIQWSWSASSGSSEALESGELAGSERVVYWRLNGNGDEERLDTLGVVPLAVAEP